MNSERLRNVIRAVKEGDAKDFDMSRYVKLESKGCGSPACALGHYAARQDLQQEFHLEQWRVIAQGGWNDTDAFERIVGKHFDLTIKEITELFGGFGCGSFTMTVSGSGDEAFSWKVSKPITALEAIAYIENFIAKHEDADAAEELIQSTKEEQHELVEQRG